MADNCTARGVATDNNESKLTEESRPAEEARQAEDPKPARKRVEESQIVHKVNAHDNQGRPVFVTHGPMPVSEWADYEKENGL